MFIYNISENKFRYILNLIRCMRDIISSFNFVFLNLSCQHVYIIKFTFQDIINSEILLGKMQKYILFLQCNILRKKSSYSVH